MTEFLVTSSALIIAVTILHFLFRGRISRRLQYALWLPVLLRLLMPFPLPGSPFSVMNAVPAGTSAPVRSVVTGGAVSSTSVSAAGPLVPAVSTGASALPLGGMGTAEIFRLVWLVGSIAVLLWFLGTNLLFATRLHRTRKAFDAADFPLPVYVSRSAVSPCLFGFLHPAVYLTPKAAELGDNLRYVLAHELCHYRHRDNIWSVLRGVCLAAYWWNPLVWAAAILSRDDGELACDEAVIRQIGGENRLAYGRTLVDMVAVKKTPSGMMCTATTMASGKRGIKARLNMIIRNPKTLIPALAVVLAAAVVCIAATFTGATRGNGNRVVSSSSVRSAGVSSSQLKVASGYAKELWDNRVKYIGDASANSALLRAIGMPVKLGTCTLELKTNKEPYILRIVGTGKVTDPAALDKEMNRDAALLLALIGNATEVQWQYNNASGQHNPGRFTDGRPRKRSARRKYQSFRQFAHTGSGSAQPPDHRDSSTGRKSGREQPSSPEFAAKQRNRPQFRCFSSDSEPERR